MKAFFATPMVIWNVQKTLAVIHFCVSVELAWLPAWGMQIRFTEILRLELSKLAEKYELTLAHDKNKYKLNVHKTLYC